MRSDNLIQKILKASLICGIAYNALYLLLYCFMPQLFGVLDPIFWHVGERSAIIGGTDWTMKLYPGTVLFALLRFAVFFGLWMYIGTMTDPQRFSIAGGVLLAAYTLITPWLGLVVRYFELRSAAVNGAGAYTARTIYDQVFSYIACIGGAANILAFMAFAMLWHKNASLNDQIQ